VTLKANRAILYLGVSTVEDSLSDAQENNNQRIAAVMTALTDTLMIPAERIATTEFNIYTVSEWQEQAKKEVTRFQVRHMLSIISDDISAAGHIIDTAVEAGANVVNYVEFTSTLMSGAYDEALKSATEEAKRKAQILADAAEVRLGAITAVDNTGYSQTYGVSNRMTADMKAEAAGQSTQLSPGMLSVTASVTVTWDIRDED